ncbi:unnamed protein product [Bathycoccus prasinos]
MCSISIFIVAFSILNLSVSVYANQPIVRFKNRTVGILADADAGVFTATENVTILGDLEVKATNKKVNITEKVDSLIRLQSNMELRVNGFVQHANMGVVCDPEGTEYRSRNFETGEFGACVCKKGYMGETCSIRSPVQITSVGSKANAKKYGNWEVIPSDDGRIIDPAPFVDNGLGPYAAASCCTGSYNKCGEEKLMLGDSYQLESGKIKVAGWKPACELSCHFGHGGVTKHAINSGLHSIPSSCHGAKTVAIEGGGHCGWCYFEDMVVKFPM